MYSLLYHNICVKGMQRKSEYKKYSGLHKHHIIPKHKGGADTDDNLTYLTVNEHIAAHFLLWKLHKEVNDLRSMKMLGAKLTIAQRKAIGRWCFHNKIGMFSVKETKEQRENRISKGISKQIETKVGIFDEENRKKFASIGGKASFQSGNNKKFAFWCSSEGIKLRARLGGLAHKNKKCMYKPGDQTFIKVDAKDIESKLIEGYIFGKPKNTKPRARRSMPNRRKSVSDGISTYTSVYSAAVAHGITPSCIIYRCKSEKSSWHYVCDT